MLSAAVDLFSSPWLNEWNQTSVDPQGQGQQLSLVCFGGRASSTHSLKLLTLGVAGYRLSQQLSPAHSGHNTQSVQRKSVELGHSHWFQTRHGGTWITTCNFGQCVKTFGSGYQGRSRREKGLCSGALAVAACGAALSLPKVVICHRKLLLVKVSCSWGIWIL